MIVLPWLAAAISLAFALHLLVRFARGRSWAEGAWAVALLMYAVASAALALGVGDGWSTAEFRVYWLFGAVLNVPWLGLGEIYLLSRYRGNPPLWVQRSPLLVSLYSFFGKHRGHVALVVLLALSAYAASEVRSAALATSVLAREEFFTGKEILGEDATARTLAMIYSYAGTALLVLGILWSTLGMRGRPELRSRLYGVLLIAGGALVVAGGAAFAAAGNFAGFSLTLTAGVAVMYWGFLTATRRA